MDNPEIVLQSGDTISVSELAVILQQYIGAGNSIFDAKGDLVVGTGPDTAAKLSVGANGQSLVADSTVPVIGVKWSTPSGTGDVVGPGSAADNLVALFSGATGKAIKSSGVILTQPTLDHVALGDPHSQYAFDSDLAGKQSVVTILTDFVGLSYGSNALKILRVNAAANGLEWTTNAGGGTGDVVGPASSVTNRVAIFSGTTGKLIADSGLLLSGSNTGDQTIALTGDVTGSGTGSFAATIASDAVSNTKLANMATKTYKGRTTAATGDPEDVAVATLKTDLVLVKADVGLSNVDNTADVSKSVANAVEWAGAALTISASAPSGGADGDIWFKY